MFKKLKIVTNHKTNKQTIEYRIYSEQGTFKTCAPTKWLHLNLPDKTTQEDIAEANMLLVRNKIAGNMGKGVELNMLCKKYVSEGKTAQEAYAAFAKTNSIAQLTKN